MPCRIVLIGIALVIGASCFSADEAANDHFNRTIVEAGKNVLLAQKRYRELKDETASSQDLEQIENAVQRMEKHISRQLTQEQFKESADLYTKVSLAATRIYERASQFGKAKKDYDAALKLFSELCATAKKFELTAATVKLINTVDPIAANPYQAAPPLQEHILVSSTTQILKPDGTRNTRGGGWQDYDLITRLIDHNNREKEIVLVEKQLARAKEELESAKARVTRTEAVYQLAFKELVKNARKQVQVSPDDPTNVAMEQAKTLRDSAKSDKDECDRLDFFWSKCAGVARDSLAKSIKQLAAIDNNPRMVQLRQILQGRATSALFPPELNAEQKEERKAREIEFLGLCQELRLCHAYLKWYDDALPKCGNARTDQEARMVASGLNWAKLAGEENEEREKKKAVDDKLRRAKFGAMGEFYSADSDLRSVISLHRDLLEKHHAQLLTLSQLESEAEILCLLNPALNELLVQNSAELPAQRPNDAPTEYERLVLKIKPEVRGKLLDAVEYVEKAPEPKIAPGKTLGKLDADEPKKPALPEKPIPQEKNNDPAKTGDTKLDKPEERTPLKTGAAPKRVTLKNGKVLDVDRVVDLGDKYGLRIDTEYKVILKTDVESIQER